MHHIVSDGWSLGVLIKELGSIMEAFRQGRPPELAPLPIQYVDYSVWQRTWLEEGGILKQQLAYWQEKLAGVPESLDLATDYPRPSVRSFAGATYAFALDAQLTGQLKSLAEQQGRHTFYDPAGCLQGIAVSLHGTKRYLCRKSDRQPAVWRNGRLDRRCLSTPWLCAAR